jgi:carboxylesterase type B
MQRSVLFFLALALTALGQSTKDFRNPVVFLPHANYVGSHNTTLNQTTWYGFQYARNPSYKNRWSNPVPVPEAPETIPETRRTINASTPKSPCIQTRPSWLPVNTTVPLPTASGSDECLTLDVVAPDHANHTFRLPVYVYIHGGGYLAGDSPSILPTALMAHTGNSFVGVSIQYRLGAWGFMGGPSYRAQGGGANLGIQDQRLALEWVKKNIHYFGGDPERIVLGGGSAGGGSVSALMALEGGDSLEKIVSGAVVEYPWWQQYLKEEQLERQYQYVLKEVNCTDLDCLRTTGELQVRDAVQRALDKAYKAKEYPHGSFWFGPYVDGVHLRDLPSREFRSGNVAKVPVLVTRDMYEGPVFSNRSMTREEEKADSNVTFQYGGEVFQEKLYELYPANSYNSTFWRRATWFGSVPSNNLHYPVNTNQMQ